MLCPHRQHRLVVLVGSPLHGAELAHAPHATRSTLQKMSALRGRGHPSVHVVPSLEIDEKSNQRVLLSECNAK